MIIQIILIGFSIFAITTIIIKKIKKEIKVFSTLFWLFLFSSIIVLSLMPSVMSIISKFFGVQRGVDLFIYLSIIGLFYSAFKIFTLLEKLEQDITKCVREVAMIRCEYEETTKKNNRQRN